MRRGSGAILLVALVYAGPAHADQVGSLSAQLQRSPDYKVRLSAALSLARTHDLRAVAAMTWALQNDSEATVRGVAALALARMVDDSLPQSVRDLAINALERAAKRDRDSKVRQSAAKSFERVRGLRSSRASPNGTKPAVFINVGQAADPTRATPPGGTEKIRGTVRRTLRQLAPDYAQTWNAGSLPTQAELQSAGTVGFFVGASVAQLDVVRQGNRAEVRCSVHIRVGPWTGRDGDEKLVAEGAASASGSGKVISSASDAGVSSAKIDCLIAVVEQITAHEVVPFIRRTSTH